MCDNSGAKEALCIRVLGGTKRRYASVGAVIVVSIKSVIPSSAVSYTHLEVYKRQHYRRMLQNTNVILDLFECRKK